MQIYSDKIFETPVEIIDTEDLKQGFSRIEALLKQGLHLLGYIKYDSSRMYFEAFKSFKKYTPSKRSGVGVLVEAKITKEEYLERVEFIKEKIKDGITYEVNYTYPSKVRTNAADLELYEFLLEKQTTPYNAFIKSPHETILSFSPELFFKLKGPKILTKPMKGTAPIAQGQRDFLYRDTKNRAENIMIVDLLRNDLGRIAKTGSVTVDKLFEIEEHPTVYQMTSEISAELKDSIGLYDIFKAIYPCGSITGAPKLSTMRVIDEVEPFSREIYCGAIGYLYKDEAVFSVPIRILQKKINESDFTYHAGGAIVWDSNPEDEWEETLTKTKFLQTDFSLIETAVDDWESHVNRMKTSAVSLGFVWNPEIEALKIPEDKVLRVVLNKEGKYFVEIKDFPKCINNKIRIKGKVDSTNPFLYHKTSIRAEMPKDVFDEIRVNERGEITEGIFTNVGILKGGKYYTPPICSGLLAGTYRKKLDWEEKVLYPEDLKTADKIFCFNSVRGIVEVELCL